MWSTGGAWLALSVWEHYRFTKDLDTLRTRYPIPKGAAQFFLDSLVTDPIAKALVTCPSVSPEHGHHEGGGGSLCAGPTMDNQLLTDLFSATVATSELIGTDAEFRARVVAARERLAPIRIGVQGQLQEWQQDWDATATDPQHRHLLPALPPDLSAGSVRGLLARGGFEVDIAWRNGSLSRARIQSRSGSRAVLRSAGRVSVTAAGLPVAVRRPETGVIAFDTDPGAEYLVRPS